MKKDKKNAKSRVWIKVAGEVLLVLATQILFWYRLFIVSIQKPV